jgi:hypothetical protein
MRPGYQPPKIERPAKKEGGIHFKSNVSGLRSENERWHRFTIKNGVKTPTRKERAISASKALSKRKVRTVKAKSAVKGTRKAKRATKSASPKRLPKRKHTMKSR